jgi:phosphatidylethanolamine-binding protein (PEBP) family uncharacterized protein
VAAGLSGVVLCGCGGGPAALKPGVVAQVGNVPIGEAELNHLISLEATVASKNTGAKVTEPVILDPPNYTTCVANKLAARQAEGLALHTHGKPSASAQLSPAETKRLSAFWKTFCAGEYGKFEPPALEGLIYQDWILGEAADLGLHVAPAEIQSQLSSEKAALAKQSAYQKLLNMAGLTSADLARKATISLLTGKLGSKVSTQIMAEANSQGVSHAQIAANYKENLRKYEHPETRNVQLILTESFGSALQAKREIASGKSFASVEKRVSQYPEEQVKKDGGLLPEALMRKKFETIKHSTPGASTPNDEKIFEEAIFSAKEYVLTGPVKTSEAYFLFQVTKINKEEPTGTLAQAEGAIKSTLIYHHGESMFANFNAELEKRWKAKTNCAKNFVVAYCEQYNPPKPSSAMQERSEYARKQKEAAARQTTQASQIPLTSGAITNPSVLARENNHRPQIAARYTCDGGNAPLSLQWAKLPSGTAEVAIGVYDLSVSQEKSVIWLVSGISPSVHSITTGSLPTGVVTGRNSSGKADWGGICPAKGPEHAYVFRVEALKKKSGLKPGFDRKEFEEQLRGALGEGSLGGSYERR